MNSPPSTEVAAKTCSRHRRKPAVGTCASCAQPMCRSCLVPTKVGLKCTNCTGQKATTSKKAAGGRPRWVLPATFVALVALVALVSNTLGGDDDDAAGPVDSVAGGPSDRGVDIEGANGLTISGTLSLPEGATSGAGLPALVIIGGYGPTNRDGRAPEGGIADPINRDLSDAFVEAGMVTYRYDKRGTARSQLPEGEPLRFEDMVADAAAAVAFLAERAEVDPERIAVVGHEEGGLVAMRLAATEPAVRGLALISVPGRPLVEVIADDILGSPHPEYVPALRSVVEPLVAGRPLPTPIPTTVAGYFPLDQQDYLRDIFSLDPAALAAEVDAPVLLMRGEKATFVNEADEKALVDAFGPNAEPFVAAGTGPSLNLVQAPAQAPKTGETTRMGADHDGIGTAPTTERSERAIGTVLDFLKTATAARS